MRAFQQRAALYIAAYYGHMGLATAMLKVILADGSDHKIALFDSKLLFYLLKLAN